LALLGTGMRCAAQSIETQQAAETGFANFAFASEAGSGIYDIGGRTIQVYGLPFAYGLREAQPHGGRPGIELILPVTIGFYDFQAADLVHLHLPSHIGSLSIEPGVKLDYWVKDAWHLYPYVKAGATWASSSEINAVIWGAGARSEYQFRALGGAALYGAELTYAGVHYHSDLPDDSLTRLRNGVELRYDLPWSVGERRTQLGPYAVVDYYWTAPAAPKSGLTANTWQYEIGLMFGVKPMWQVYGIDLPRIGFGYRFAGLLSGWRIVFGDPF